MVFEACAECALVESGDGRPLWSRHYVHQPCLLISALARGAEATART